MTQAWSSASLSSLSKIQGVCFDIDDTLSTEGKLTASAFQSLWKLYESGFVCVPITGRPAGWGDHIARFWPVNAVVIENGASVFYMKKGKRLRLDHPSAPRNPRPRIERLKKIVLKKFPNAKWASDQAYREYDLAIDFCEAVSPWTQNKVNSLKKLCEDEGAIAKVSSIHVNAWFGRYDKFSGFQYWLQNGLPGVSSRQSYSLTNIDRWIFIGDSPNDEPLFARFPHSVGVANIRRFLGQLESPPRYITTKKSGLGFTQVVERLIRARSMNRSS
jgi:HAD superfamily hydrolase (TIGR01484 family)